MNKRMLIFIVALILCVLLFALTPKGTPAQSNLPGETIPYTGKLSDAAGRPAPDGAYDLLFELYDGASGGQRLWTEMQLGVAVKDSQMRTALGAVTPLPASLSSKIGYWLAVSVRGPGDATFTLLDPRQAFTASAAADTNAVSALSCPHSHFSDSWSGTSSAYGLMIENIGTGDALRVFSNSSGINNGGIFVTNMGAGYGILINSSGGHGIDTTTNGPNQSGIYTHTTATNANGMVANASSGYGVFATSGSGVGVSARSTSGFGLQAGGKDDSGLDLFGDVLLEGSRGEILTNGDQFNLYTNGDLNIDLDNNNNTTGSAFNVWNGNDTLAFSVNEAGNSVASGTKSAVVQTADYAERLVYSIESPEVWLEDFGTAQLSTGSVTVPFDPIFLQTINPQAEYHVYLTPLCGEAVLLFVTTKTETGFSVQGVTLTNQPSSCSFDYRVVAKRAGYESQRLAPYTPAVKP
jgi:hypothetical protein